MCSKDTFIDYEEINSLNKDYLYWESEKMDLESMNSHAKEYMFILEKKLKLKEIIDKQMIDIQFLNIPLNARY